MDYPVSFYATPTLENSTQNRAKTSFGRVGNVSFNGNYRTRCPGEKLALQHPMAPVTQPSAHGLLPTLATGLSSATISRRVTKACQFAGAGGGFRGHFGRVGMAVDLAALDTGATGPDESRSMGLAGHAAQVHPERRSCPWSRG